jgi:hypothetical protein
MLKKVKEKTEKYGWILAIIGVLPDIWFFYEIVEKVKHNMDNNFLLGVSGIFSGLSIVALFFWLWHTIELWIKNKDMQIVMVGYDQPYPQNKKYAKQSGLPFRKMTHEEKKKWKEIARKNNITDIYDSDMPIDKFVEIRNKEETKDNRHFDA